MLLEYWSNLEHIADITDNLRKMFASIKSSPVLKKTMTLLSVWKSFLISDLLFL